MHPRYPEIDILKAAAIVAVVLIHSLHPFFYPGLSSWEEITLRATRFAVPTFLTVSGFLYYSATPITLGTMVRRSRRLLLPYCCVSLAAYGYGMVFPQRLTGPLWKGLLEGSVFGPYYYVFVLAVFVPLTWVLSRLPARLLLAVFVVAALSSALTEVSAVRGEAGAFWRTLGFWTVRSPQLWGGWLMFGWVAAAYRGPVFSLTLRYRSLFLRAWVLLLIAWLPVGVTHLVRGPGAGVIDLLLILANVVGVFVLGRGLTMVPMTISVLSNRTYTIYLLHPFFVYLVDDVLVGALDLHRAVSIPLAWCGGILGPLAIAALARAMLGHYARDVVGA